MNAKEYRDLIGLMKKLNDLGLLDEFLEKAEQYWINVNVFSLAMKEREKGGTGVIGQIKADWPRLWPASLEEERTGAFDIFSSFWTRLDASKLIDKVMKEVLPDMGKSDEGMKDVRELKESIDTKTLMAMSEEERSVEILRRLGTVDIVKQFAILSKGDVEVQAIGGQMAPFIAKFVAILERKISTQTEELGDRADKFSIVAGISVVFLILALTGIFNPLGEIWNAQIPGAVNPLK